MAEPVQLLRWVRTWLQPTGRLHVVVPNADSLHRRVGVAMGALGRVDELSERDRRFGQLRKPLSQRLRGGHFLRHEAFQQAQ